MTKFQSPDKLQLTKHQSPNRLVIRLLVFGDYLVFGIWCLVISFSGVAGAAEVSPKTYERTANELGQTIQSVDAMHQDAGGCDAVFRRDPLRPLVDAQGQLISSAGMSGGLSVQGIIWSDERPLAVIDDELFAQGDTVGPYTIVQIRADGVTVRRGDETIAIPLDRGLPPASSQ